LRGEIAFVHLPLAKIKNKRKRKERAAKLKIEDGLPLDME
jgi:hypothetical protein